MVSVGMVVYKDGKILVGKSTNNGSPQYVLPVGHLEYLESFEECADRELAEECGITVSNYRLQFVSNTDAYKPKHYIHVGLIADWESGEAYAVEKDKMDEWIWFDIDNLPSPLSKGAKLTIESLISEKNLFDFK